MCCVPDCRTSFSLSLNFFLQCILFLISNGITYFVVLFVQFFRIFQQQKGKTNTWKYKYMVTECRTANRRQWLLQSVIIFLFSVLFLFSLIFVCSWNEYVCSIRIIFENIYDSIVQKTKIGFQGKSHKIFEQSETKCYSVSRVCDFFYGHPNASHVFDNPKK